MIGTGYVGLVSGVCFSDLGNDVICVDKDVNKINLLKNGKVPIYEPGLSELVIKNFNNKRLNFSTDLKKSVTNSDIIFICVGTPTKKGGEIHITDAIKSLIHDNNKFVAHNFSGKYLDCGSMQGYMNSTLEIAKS